MRICFRSLLSIRRPDEKNDQLVDCHHTTTLFSIMSNTLHRTPPKAKSSSPEKEKEVEQPFKTEEAKQLPNDDAKDELELESLLERTGE